MKWKAVLKILLGIVAFILLIKILTVFLVEPWIGKKLQAKLLEMDSDFVVEIEDVDILFLKAGIELQTIKISSKPEADSIHKLYGEIAYIKLKGIDLSNAIFNKDIDIREVSISNGSLNGKIKIPEEKKSPTLSSVNINIDKVVLDNIAFNIKNTSSALTYVLKDGFGNISHFVISKNDTLSISSVDDLDFKAGEVLSVSADSLYEYKAVGILYSENSGKLTVNELSIHPNYDNYDFTSRSKFQTDCIQAELNNISLVDFSALDYLKSKSVVSSYLEIEKMKMEVFRDKRKVFKHQVRPTFQDLIYDYPGNFHIDSTHLFNGSITYIEHIENSTNAGKINFEEINAKIYKITNDTIYKKEDAFLELTAEALLMGKGKMDVSLKAKLFDKNNSFNVSGNLASLAVKELNPMLENNAFLYANSGKIEAMHFNFHATNHKSTGTLTMIYHDLHIDPKSSDKDFKTVFNDAIYSIVTHNFMLDSNPSPGDKVREGTIEFERDPEKFIFNYCFKSILSGIKSSLFKRGKEKRK